MDLLYAKVHTPEGNYITLQRETMRKHHVEDPVELENEFVYKNDVGSYVVFTIDVTP